MPFSIIHINSNLDNFIKCRFRVTDFSGHLLFQLIKFYQDLQDFSLCKIYLSFNTGTLMIRVENLCIYFLLMQSCNLYSAQTTLLIKIPTRSRPYQFFKTLDSYYQHLSFTIPYTFLISCDVDDETMNNPQIINRLQHYPNLEFSFSANKSKVEAYNKDIDKFEFDILIAASDDMVPIVRDFDIAINNAIHNDFPDLDGVLNLNDGAIGGQCNTIPIIGRAFYERFGYIYNPAYSALVCNVELTNISKILKKEKIIDQVLIKHMHPAWGLAPIDDLYRKNESHHNQDLQTFNVRRAAHFDLTQGEINQVTPKLWSILICTIEGREKSFNRLYTTLHDQITTLHLNDQIEILYCKDKRGEHTIGHKRNILIDQSVGKYISFIDDDDEVRHNYIEIIYEKLLKNPDCVSLMGIITVNGENPKKFIHSIQYDHYFEENNVYYRPPNHLNPIRRSIACQFVFPDKNFSEDTSWAMAIANSRLLLAEEIIYTPYYFYFYDELKK